MQKSPFIKALSFLAILTILDFLFRKGIFFQIIPVPLPQYIVGLVIYGLFALLALFITSKFCQLDSLSLKNIGISLDKSNKREFAYGLLIGTIVWSVVSVSAAFFSGFWWELHLNNVILNITMGLLFVFLADLGTELYVRGYGLTQLKNRFGIVIAIILISLFVGFSSFSANSPTDLMIYAMIIPALHAVFFSIIYFKTGRLGGALGLHTGGNFATISLFDFSGDQSGSLILPGLFHPDSSLEGLSIHAIQLPFIIAALILIAVVYFWKPDNSQLR